LVEGGKKELDREDQLVPGRRLPVGHEVISEPGVVIVRQDVAAVAGESRNIRVSAAGGRDGLNGTHPRRVTARIKLRRYSHFDHPLTAEQLERFAMTPGEVQAHAFLPLLGYKRVKRKIDFSVFPPSIKEKGREIRYAAHRDAAVYSQYGRKLSELYEGFLGKSPFDRSVLAYRSGIGYNVPFAKSLFDEIRARDECTVLCIDISGFFDNLDHKRLKAALQKVLNAKRLPGDWFKIFERLTSFEFIEKRHVEDEIGRSSGGRICSSEVFRRKLRPLIQKNQNVWGIPQGTPLSGLLANIYMIDFDQALHDYVVAMGGSYRRYSDDIAIVLPAALAVDDILDVLRSRLAEHRLSMNEDKTCITRFRPEGGRLVYEGDLLQYLGFTFDGRRTLIRSESIKNFYARMKGNIRRYVRAAAKKSIALDQLRKRVLVGRFTHWGDSRNFVQYAYRAARELNAPEIKRQLRNHVDIFDRHWAKAVAKHSV
jgi:hypothetical protein